MEIIQEGIAHSSDIAEAANLTVSVRVICECACVCMCVRLSVCLLNLSVSASLGNRILHSLLNKKTLFLPKSNYFFCRKYLFFS